MIRNNGEDKPFVNLCNVWSALVCDGKTTVVMWLMNHTIIKIHDLNRTAEIVYFCGAGQKFDFKISMFSTQKYERFLRAPNV